MLLEHCTTENVLLPGGITSGFADIDMLMHRQRISLWKCRSGEAHG